MKSCLASSHITDSMFFRQGYSTDECRRIFCDRRRMQRWLDVEAALARCQGDLGIIPAEVARQLAETARLDRLDLAFIQAEIRRTSHSLVPLLRAWQRIIPGEAGQFVHFGATTQDIQDTAQSLEMRDVLAITDRDLRAVMSRLADLAERHRDLVMVGRTHGQHALPTTLGLKIAGWLDEAMRGHQRLLAIRSQAIPAQLFGGVGTMEALSDQAMELLTAFASALGLSVPRLCWHSARDRIAEYLSTLALLTGGLARAANEIYELAKNEVQELFEPSHEDQVGSSTMPHKRNPELCEQVVVLSRIVKAQAGLGLDALVSAHERDYRAVRLEWISVTEASLATCCALSMMRFILDGLVVNESQITRNTLQSAELISTEAMMFELGRRLGKQTAHELIHAAAGRAARKATTLTRELAETPEVQNHFSAAEVEAMIRPLSHTGKAVELVMHCVREARALLAETPSMPAPAPCPAPACAACPEQHP